MEGQFQFYHIMRNINCGSANQEIFHTPLLSSITLYFRYMLKLSFILRVEIKLWQSFEVNWGGGGAKDIITISDRKSVV